MNYTYLIGLFISDKNFDCLEDNLNRRGIVCVQVIEVVLESEDGFLLVLWRLEDCTVGEMQVACEHKRVWSDEVAELRENDVLCFPEEVVEVCEERFVFDDCWEFPD